MSDEIQIENAAGIEEVVVAPSIGRYLSAAREQQGISVEDVARNLKIAIRQVEALESDDYAKLPGVTFIKGFIRNYAKLLQIDPEPLVSSLQGAMPGQKFKPILSPNARIEISTTATKPWLWLVLLLMVIIVAVPLLIYEKLHSESRPAAPIVKEAAVPVAPLSPQVVIEVPASEQDGVSLPTPARESAVTEQQDVQVKQEPAVENVEDGVPPPVVGGGAASVKMNFSKDAWVEIRDKTGKRIYSQLNRAGSEQVVQGNPPLSIVLGNASNVSITYNGKQVDLAPYIKVDVARLTLE